MTTDRDILTLAQWLSPAYPVGAFAYSHGLEAAIHVRAITSGDDLKAWLTDIISHGSGGTTASCCARHMQARDTMS